MKFKLDENLPQELSVDLRELGYDSDTVVEEGLSGAEDRIVIQAARASDRILLTLDKGIASLLQYPIHEHAGVILFRPDSLGRGAIVSFVRLRLSALLDLELQGRLTVVGPRRIRIR